MADIKELGNKIVASLGSLIAAGVLIAIIVWTGAEIYFEFQHLKRETIRIEERLDKITKRDREADEKRDKEIADRVNVLELPNSDK